MHYYYYYFSTDRKWSGNKRISILHLVPWWVIRSRLEGLLQKREKHFTFALESPVAKSAATLLRGGIPVVGIHKKQEQFAISFWALLGVDWAAAPVAAFQPAFRAVPRLSNMQTDFSNFSCPVPSTHSTPPRSLRSFSRLDVLTRPWGISVRPLGAH